MEQTLIGHLRYVRIYLMQGNHFGQVQAVLDLVTMTERNSPSGQKQKSCCPEGIQSLDPKSWGLILLYEGPFH